MMKVLAVIVLLLPGCDLYFGGGDDIGDDDCVYDTTVGAGEAFIELRDPTTGICQSFGGYPCDGVCGPCGAGAPAPDPDWGVCYGACSGLDEQSCMLTGSCYAAYLEDTSIDDAQPTREFWGCWDTAPSGPVQGGQCLNLDAHECSRHDDCKAIYDSSFSTSFLSCEPELVPEPPACDVVDCGSGFHCEEQCHPGDTEMSYCEPVCVEDQTCATVDCGPGYTCAEVCADGNGQTTCGPTCVPSAACETLTDEMTCSARTDCTPVYDGQDCTCYPNGCECQVLTYERCETL